MSDIVFLENGLIQIDADTDFIYTAVLLNGVTDSNSPVIGKKNGRDTLLKRFPAKFSKEFAHHMTIEFKPTDHEISSLGKVVSLRVIGYAEDDKCQAVVVEPMDRSLNVKNPVPHITISTNGVNPSYSNTLLQKGYEVLQDPFYIKGMVVGTVSSPDGLFYVYSDDSVLEESLEEELPLMGEPIIYCDMDGVLTNFDKEFKKYFYGEFRDTELYRDNKDTFDKFPDIELASDVLSYVGGLRFKVTKQLPLSFWVNMEWMPDGRVLWDFIKEKNPIIISTPAASTDSRTGKYNWVGEKLGRVPIILADKKKVYVKNQKHRIFNSNTVILIDDTKRNIDEWESAGGIGILHKSAAQTINQLKKFYVK